MLLTDPIDEFVMPSLGEYKGKHFQAADKGDLESDKTDKAIRDAASEPFKKLFEYLKGLLKEVGDVRLSTRLKESAACLVAGEGAMGAHMERLMQRMGRAENMPETKRILELNGDHEAVKALRDLMERAPEDPRIEQYGRLLYDQAVLAEGSTPKDPAAMARRINELLIKDAAR